MQTNQTQSAQISALIRNAIQSSKSKGQKPTQSKPKGKGGPAPRVDEHGALGDFSRSNSNPPSRSISNSASVGFEDVSGNGDGSILAMIRIAINATGNAPSKRAAKRLASPKMTRSDRVFAAGNGCGPGSSKSPTLDAIKAIAAKETGCIVTKKQISESESAKNANTTQGNYIPMIVE